jgi:hypothetical protein
MVSFNKYVDWLDTQTRRCDDITHFMSPSPSSFKINQSISIAKHSPRPNHLISSIEKENLAPGFSSCLMEYLNKLTSDPISNQQLHQYFHLPFKRVNTFYSFKFNPVGLEDGEMEKDTVKAIPKIKGSAARFDTVVVLNTNNAESTGLEGQFILMLFS